MTSASGGVLALVPARGGSKGVPDKNLRPLAGLTLIERVAMVARGTTRVTRTVLTTDSEAIAALGRKAGLEVPFMRPPELARDDTPMLPVIGHALAELERQGWTPEHIVLLQPTSPLRRASHVDEVLSRLLAMDADSVVTVVEVPRHFTPDYVMRIDDRNHLQPFLPTGPGVTRRQDARRAFSRDGTAYAFRRQTLDRFHDIYGEKCLPFVIDAAESLSIDSPEDWARAEALLGGPPAPRSEARE